MDKESIFRLGLNYIPNIDLGKSDEVYDPTTNNHIIKLYLIKGTELICPHCGLINSAKLRSSIKQTLYHASAIENNITIEFHRNVYLCDCGMTFREESPFQTSGKYTIQKIGKILYNCKDIGKSFSDIAREFNVSVTTVKRIFESRVDIKPQKLTQVLCVDEVYSKHCGFHKYCFITYSPQLDKILDVLPSRNKNDLLDYFARIPLDERLNVKYFSMDLYDIYKQVAQLAFPNALICADHFHVIKNLTENFNAARIRIMKKYEKLKFTGDNYYWLYKRYWKLLLKNRDKLKYKKFKVTRSGMYLDEHQIVDYMLSIDKDLNDAYYLLNEYKIFNSAATIKNAEEWLDELIIKYHNSSLSESYKSYKLLKKWRIEIINSFNTINGFKISNGGLERANRDVKTIIRNAYGFTDFTTLRNRVMFIKNQDAPIKNSK